AARSADGCALPLRPPGRGACPVPGREDAACRRARHRARPGTAGAGAGDPASGVGPGRAAGPAPSARDHRLRRSRPRRAPRAADELERLLGAAPCDVALAPRPELVFEPAAPVVVPFGGGREEWAALELAAWIARTHGLALTLVGTEAMEGRRDASRLLAGASLALQRFTGTKAEPVLVAPGAAGILEQPGSLLVASLPELPIDRTRGELAE